MRRIALFGVAAAVVAGLSLGPVWRVLYPLPFAPVVRAAAARYDMSPFLVAAVIRAESKGRPDAVSGRGAIGLMQVMPATGAWAAAHMGLGGFTPAALRRPAVNVAIGTWYLSGLVSHYHGNLSLALAAYNGGEQTVDDWLRSGAFTGSAGSHDEIPFPQTRDFVRTVLASYAVYRHLYAPATGG